MNVGFNQNVKYNGEVYHIQTEDGGLGNPVITTVAFKGGVIITSVRTGYSDMLKSDGLDAAVRKLMREQHQGVVKDLLTGRLDKLLKEGPGA